MKTYKLIDFIQISDVAVFLPLLIFEVIVGLVTTFAQVPVYGIEQNPWTTIVLVGWIYFKTYLPIIAIIIGIILLFFVFRFGSIIVNDDGTLTLKGRLLSENKVLKVTDIQKILRKNSSIVTGLAKDRLQLLPLIEKIKFVTNKGNYTIYINDTELNRFFSDFPGIKYDASEFKEEKILYFLLFLIIAVTLIGLVSYNSFYITQ